MLPLCYYALGKSGYTCINSTTTDRNGILLNNGFLEYKDEVKYLGVFINEKGSLKYDNKKTWKYTI